MAGIGNCSEFQTLTAGSGITIAKTGAGKLSDPEVNTIGANISSANGNVIQVLADGSLFVSACDAGSGLRSVVTNTGATFPADTNGQVTVGIRYDSGTNVQFSSSTGIFTIPFLNTLDESTWPLTCDISNGDPVYRDQTGTGAGRLYVEPNTGVKSFSEYSASDLYTGVTYTPGLVLNQIEPTVTTPNNCGRDVLMEVNYDFGGFEVQLQGNDQIIAVHEVRSPLTNTWVNYNTTRAQASGFDNPSTIFLTVGQLSATRSYVIPASQTTSIPGMRTRITTVVGNPSVGTNVTNAQVRANRATVIFHGLD